ncbi:MAG: methyltransferase domain-containing protein [Desulfobacteraceae bacterium]
MKEENHKKMNVMNYDRRALSIDSPMYAYYANKIMEKTGVIRGVCVDAGSGGGYLGLALACITDLDFIFLDLSEKMLERAEYNIKNAGLQGRAKTLHADVHKIPMENESVDLVISRGSIPFWNNPVAALGEMYRILAPGGKVYVGTGRGTQEVREQVEAKRKEMGEKLHEWNKSPRRRNGMNCDYDGIQSRINIVNFKLNRGEDGSWIQMWK